MATKERIIALPNSSLRDRSKKIGIITPGVQQIIADMKSATLDWEASRPHELGVALAAVQIDELVRVVIVRNNFDDKEDKTFSVFINPQITKYEGEIEEDFEGCLSVTDIYGKVPRYSKVKIRAQDEDGRELRVKAEGFLARVFQHEIDHINGVMFVDHIKDNKQAFYKLNAEGKLEKLDYEKIQQADILRD